MDPIPTAPEREEKPETLGDRVRARLAALSLSQRKAARLAGLKEDSVRSMLRRDTDPRGNTLARLAPVLGVTVDWLTGGGPTDTVTQDPVSGRISATPRPQVQREPSLPLRGKAAAGLWLEPDLTDETDGNVPLGCDPRWASEAQWALTLEGDSLDLVYPSGASVHVVALNSYGRAVVPGDLVVLRRTRGQLTERTVKEIKADRLGRLQAWPRSTNPRWQAPVDLGKGLTDADTPDADRVEIEGVVIGAYLPRR